MDKSMTDYKKMLKTTMESSSQLTGFPKYSKLSYIGSIIFDFTTYDQDMDELFAKNMLDVIECILEGTTCDYIERSNANYINYLTMVNMPFLKPMITWGTSIRTAWFEKHEVGWFDIGYDTVDRAEIKECMKALIEWSKE